MRADSSSSSASSASSYFIQILKLKKQQLATSGNARSEWIKRGSSTGVCDGGGGGVLSRKVVDNNKLIIRVCCMALQFFSPARPEGLLGARRSTPRDMACVCLCAPAMRV